MEWGFYIILIVVVLGIGLILWKTHQEKMSSVFEKVKKMLSSDSDNGNDRVPTGKSGPGRIAITEIPTVNATQLDAEPVEVDEPEMLTDDEFATDTSVEIGGETDAEAQRKTEPEKVGANPLGKLSSSVAGLAGAIKKPAPEERGEIFLASHRSAAADENEPYIIRLTCTGNVDRGKEGYVFQIKRSDLPLCFSCKEDVHNGSCIVFAEQNRALVEEEQCVLDIVDGHVMVTDLCSVQGTRVFLNNDLFRLLHKDNENSSVVLTEPVFDIKTGFVSTRVEMLPGCSEYITDRFVRLEVHNTSYESNEADILAEVRNNDTFGRFGIVTVRDVSVSRRAAYFRIGQDEPDSIVAVGEANIFTLPSGEEVSKVTLIEGAEFDISCYHCKVIETFGGFDFGAETPEPAAQNADGNPKGGLAGVLNAVRGGRDHSEIRFIRRHVKGDAGEPVMRLTVTGPMKNGARTYEVTCKELPVYLTCAESADDASHLIVNSPGMDVLQKHCFIEIREGMLVVSDTSESSSGAMLVCNGESRKLGNFADQSSFGINCRRFNITAGWITVHVEILPAISGYISDSFARILVENTSVNAEGDLCEEPYEAIARDRFNIGRAAEDFPLHDGGAARFLGSFRINKGEPFLLCSNQGKIFKLAGQTENEADMVEEVTLCAGTVFEYGPYRFTVLEICDGIDFETV